MSADQTPLDLIKNAADIKPAGFVMSELKWRYLVRSAVRGKNVLLLGPTGTGKTMAALCLKEALNRSDRFYNFNLGSTDDPKTTLLGKTHFDKNVGTFFGESEFIRAIRTPNAIILLDEISRCHPSGWNILLSVLDDLQRYVRLDDTVDSEIVKVAEGVAFVATANVGQEYTATRVMDRALLDRFTVKLEVDILTAEQELELLVSKYPSVDVELFTEVTAIAETLRVMCKEGKIGKPISTRAVMEIGGLMSDGFTLSEIAEVVIYPDYSDTGEADSERATVKQVLQMYTTTTSNPLF